MSLKRKKRKKSDDSRPATDAFEPQEEPLASPAPENDEDAAVELLESSTEAGADHPGDIESETATVLDEEGEIPEVMEEFELESLSVEDVQEALAQARSEAEEYLDGWQRARAEFANYKKRVEREQQDAYSRIAGETLLKVLGVLDDLERALEDRPDNDDAAAWAEGIELIYRKFQGLLESIGVEPIPAEGQLFDPLLHEALSHEESEGHAEGMVIDVIQRGYRLGERVLRPAMVRVAK